MLPPRRLSRRTAAKKRTQPPSAVAESAVTQSAMAAVESRMVSMLERLLDATEAMREELDRAVARNTLQQQQIDRLHAELQEHRNGLLTRLQHPWVMGLIQIYDSLNRGARDQSVATADLAPKDAAAMLEGFREDVEIVLDQQGVVPFQAPGDRFDPVRQTAVRAVTAPEPALAGLVLLRLRPGFEQDGKILRKEWVCVYSESAR